MKGGFTLLNGKFYREVDPLFSMMDIPRLNDGVRESFRAGNNRIIFARDNFDFLVDSLSAMDLQLPEEWNFPRFVNDVSRLLNKNHLYLSAKVIIHFIPGESGTDYVMSAEEIPSGFYPVKDGGLLIEFYSDGAKGISSYNAYEPSGRAIWTMALRAAQLMSKNNLIILNNNGFACESIGGSFGYLDGKTVVFPSTESQGYFPPVMTAIKSCARQCGFDIIEKKEIDREDLLNADELFLADNCSGIKPVLGLYARRYYTTATMTIAAKLSDLAKNDHLAS